MKILAVLLVVILFSSCATIFTGTTNEIYFHTEPEDVKIEINGHVEAKAPTYLEVKRKLGKREVVFKKEGYKTKTIVLEKSFAPIAILDIVGFYGFIVDAISGAIVKYDKSYYEVKLEKK